MIKYTIKYFNGYVRVKVVQRGAVQEFERDIRLGIDAGEITSWSKDPA
jgi:hypothetical protein